MTKTVSGILMNSNMAENVVCSIVPVTQKISSMNVIECNCPVSAATMALSIPESEYSGWQSGCCVKQRFGSIFNSKRGSDVTFHVGREPNIQTIPAHKLVLSLGSEIFESMLDGFGRENVILVKLPNVDPAAFFILLRYLYTDEVMVTLDSVVPVLSLAKLYHIFALEKNCVTFFIDKLSPDNAFFLLNKAVQFKEEELSNICLEKIDDCIADAILADDFCNVDVETLCLVLERDTLKIEELALFEAVVKWSEAESRRKNMLQSTVLEKPLSFIRFSLMTAEDFAAKVVPLGLLSKCQTAFRFTHLRGALSVELIYSTTPRAGPSQQIANVEPSSDEPMSCDDDFFSACDSLSFEEMADIETCQSLRQRSGSSSPEAFVSEGFSMSQNEGVSTSGCHEASVSNEITNTEPVLKRVCNTRAKASQESKKVASVPAVTEKAEVKETREIKTWLEKKISESMLVKIEQTGIQKTCGNKVCQKNKATKSLTAKTGQIRAQTTCVSRIRQRIKTTDSLLLRTGAEESRLRRVPPGHKSIKSVSAETGKTGVRKTSARTSQKNKRVEPVPAGDGKIGSRKAQAKMYKCAHCPMKFLLERHLVHHLKSHCGQKNFSCTSCPAKFLQKSHLALHVINHAGTKLNSSVKFFPQDDSARTTSNLPRPKPLSCPACSDKFLRRIDLERHAKNHPGTKPFSCVSCPAKFACIGSLSRHAKIHSGKKRFSCSFCPAKFDYSGSLARHVKIHSGLKPFACVSCPAKFAYSESLTRHAKMHSGAKQFSCVSCPAKFFRRDGLARHSKRHLA